MKRIIQLLTAVSLAVQIAAPAALAATGDSVTIKSAKKPITRDILTAEVTSEDSDFSYQWYSADSVDGEYKTIIGATESTYRLSTIDAGKYIKVAATNNADGETVWANEAKTLSALGKVSITKSVFSETEVTKAQSTPSDNLFYVDGQGFILLGQFHDDNSKFYVMSEGFYGTKAFDTRSSAKFSPETNGNIGYFLNNEFLTDGNGGKKLPDNITKHIDKNHIWWTEKGMTGGDCADDYSFTAGVSLLSASEAQVYYGTYGWKPADGTGSWWLRTQNGSSKATADNIFVMKEGNPEGVVCTDENYIRPVFFLDADFFKDVKIDASKSGKNVGKVLKETYTAAELGKLYSEDELMKLGIKEKEFEAKLTVDGFTLKATLSNLLKQDLSKVKYQWKYKTEDDGAYTNIYKANDETYVYSTEDYGRTIAVDITPVLADGTECKTVTSTTTYKVSSFGPQSRTDLGRDKYNATEDTPKENLFTVGGQEFVLVNEYSDKNSAFLITSEKDFGRYAYSAGDTIEFNPDKDNNIGYFLNHDFLTKGNDDKKLPDDIISNIDKNHKWWTEAGDGSSGCTKDYSFTAGVSLFSNSEYAKYLGKFGWKLTDGVTATDCWWLRTSRGNGNSNNHYNIFGVSQERNGHQGEAWDKGSSDEYYIRPIFYLNEDFFKNVKITSAGANVIAMMAERYSATELLNGKAGYTISELIEMGVVKAPVAKNLSIKGSAAVNSVLIGSYEYSSNSAEGKSTYGFEISADGENYSSVAAGVKDYTVKTADAGKYIRFCCTPTDVDGVSGAKEVSRAVKISGTQDITVSKAQLSGTAATSVTPIFTLKNNAESEKNVLCIVVLYDKDGYIVEKQIKKYTLAAGEEQTENTLTLSATGKNAKSARLFVVDSLEKMNSLIGYEVVIK